MRSLFYFFMDQVFFFLSFLYAYAYSLANIHWFVAIGNCFLFFLFSLRFALLYSFSLALILIVALFLLSVMLGEDETLLMTIQKKYFYVFFVSVDKFTHFVPFQFSTRYATRAHLRLYELTEKHNIKLTRQTCRNKKTNNQPTYVIISFCTNM